MEVEAIAVMRRYDLPSVAAAIITKDNIVAVAVGNRVRGEKIPVTVLDRYHHGSNTKAMTATLIGVLVDEGKLTWDTTLGKLFPEIADMHPDFKSVTVRRLLAHRSGLDGTYPVRPANWHDYRTAPIELRKRYTQMCLSEAPAYEAGTQYKYSNKNYVIAGAIAEKLVGKPYETILQDKLLQPLGIRSAGFGPAGTSGQKDQPWPHKFENGKWIVVPNTPMADNPPVLAPAGRVHCSVPDLAKFVQAHVSRDPLLKPETWRALHEEVDGGPMALGWLVVGRSWAKGNALNHAGNNTLNHSVIWAAPNAGFGFIACTNAATPDSAKAMDELIGKLLPLVAR